MAECQTGRQGRGNTLSSAKNHQMQPVQDLLPHLSARITVRGRRVIFTIYFLSHCPEVFTSSHLQLEKVSWQYTCTVVPARRMKGGEVIQEIVQ